MSEHEAQTTAPETQNQPQTVQHVMVKPAQDGMAVASLVLGIIGLVCFLAWPISIVLGILAITFGVISHKKRKSGMALAGSICGGIAIVAALLMFAFTVILVDSASDALVEVNRQVQQDKKNSIY